MEGSGEPKPVAYTLEVYNPGSTDTAFAIFRATTPFMAFAGGQIVNPNLWLGSESPMKVLRILNVEHVVWESQDVINHKVMLFTEEIEGSQALRTTPTWRLPRRGPPVG